MNGTQFKTYENTYMATQMFSLITWKHGEATHIWCSTHTVRASSIFRDFKWSIRHSQRILHTSELRVFAYEQIIFYTERPILVFARISWWVCAFALKCVRAKMLHCVSECKGRDAYFRLECCVHLRCAIFVPEPNWALCILRNGTRLDMYFVLIFDTQNSDLGRHVLMFVQYLVFKNDNNKIIK